MRARFFFAIGAEVFEENVAEGYFADALFEVDAQGFFHARFVEGIDALRRDADFVKRQADGLSLALEKIAADAVHADALVGFGDGGEERGDVNVILLEQSVQGHGAVFAAAPAEEDGFGHFLESSVIVWDCVLPKRAGQAPPLQNLAALPRRAQQVSCGL